MTRVAFLVGVLCVAATRWLPGTGTPLVDVYGAFTGLVIAPGLALARFGAPGDPTWLRLARGLALGPLLTGALMTVMMLAGAGASVAADVTLALGYVAGVAATFGSDPRARVRPWDRRLLVWLGVLALVVLVPHLLRDWVRERSDAVFHAAVVLEMQARGLPPGDPYFAGVDLNYMWFFHTIVLALAEAAGTAPWNLAGILNAGWLVSLGAAVYALSRRVGRSGREAFLAAVFVPLGLSALFWVWLPIKLARGLTGESAGAEHVNHLLGLAPFTVDRLSEVTSSFGSRLPFLNKFWVMTAFGGGITALAWLTEGLVGIVRRRAGRADGVKRGAFLTGAAAFGCWALHPAVGLAATLGAVPAGAFLLLRPGGIDRRAVLEGALGAAIGVVLGLVLSTLGVGRASGPFPIGFDAFEARAVLVTATAALIFGIPGLAGLPAAPAARTFRALALALMAASLVIVLPPPNTAAKMAFTFYLLPATAAGWFLARWGRRLVRAGRGGWALAGFLFLVVPVNGLYLAALLAEPGPPRPDAAELELYAWLRDSTAADAVVLDTAERADVLVRVPRRQYWGREPYARQWGYGEEQMDPRRAVRDALLLPSVSAEDVEGPAAARALDGVGRFSADHGVPVFLVWRDGDRGGPGPRGVPRLTPRWRNAGYVVYEITE